MGLISRVSSRTYRNKKTFLKRFKMPPKIQKSKEAKAKAAMSSGKGKKKKWSKGKVRDKLVNLALFDKATYDKFVKEVPKYKLITPSMQIIKINFQQKNFKKFFFLNFCIVSERMKVRPSLAIIGLRKLVQDGKIKVVTEHSAQKNIHFCVTFWIFFE